MVLCQPAGQGGRIIRARRTASRARRVGVPRRAHRAYAALPVLAREALAAGRAVGGIAEPNGAEGQALSLVVDLVIRTATTAPCAVTAEVGLQGGASRVQEGGLVIAGVPVAGRWTGVRKRPGRGVEDARARGEAKSRAAQRSVDRCRDDGSDYEVTEHEYAAVALWGGGSN